ncbi:hypothetical protein K402DRAFT_399056 [Aulographum hederae CBS 113979]|uniref:Glycine zipper domain-containing protein n=1 Tax=Aulographum hederae CBS 113979 TaxID=1176131 RepID=A0A6G1GIU9_9PEZI|nr:hypothetical protein K402DRAFT_399056 [Aulographum hederae CBS 113979]
MSLPQRTSVKQLKQKQVNKANDYIKKAEESEKKASAARERVDVEPDPERKRELEAEAAKQEKIFRHQARVAKRIQSGAWQGFATGGGIGAAVGAGVGTIVGTVVGGVAAIPTTGLGMLIGAGTGAIHGPFFKLGDDTKGEKDRNEFDPRKMLSDAKEETDEAMAGSKEAEESDTDTEVDFGSEELFFHIPEDQLAEDELSEDQPGGVSLPPVTGASTHSADLAGPSTTRKKPRKLEIRSQAKA